MQPDVFSTIAESLRQYRRADSREYEGQVEDPVVNLYVDPLPGDAVLKTTLSSNTTYLVGRKGTGKSTVFARAQAEIRKREDLLSIYLDVKAVYELVNAGEASVNLINDKQISDQVLRSHLLRKHFLGTVLSDLLTELKKDFDESNLWERWVSTKRKYVEVLESLRTIAKRVEKVELTEEEVPILRLLSFA